MKRGCRRQVTTAFSVAVLSLLAGCAGGAYDARPAEPAVVQPAPRVAAAAPEASRAPLPEPRKADDKKVPPPAPTQSAAKPVAPAKPPPASAAPAAPAAAPSPPAAPATTPAQVATSPAQVAAAPAPSASVTPPPVPAAPPPATKPAWRVMLDEGVKAYDLGNYKEAVKLFKEAADDGDATAPAKVEALKYLAFSYCSLTQRTACRQQFEKALAIDPSFDLTAAERSHPTWGPEFQRAKARSKSPPAKSAPAKRGSE